MKKPLGYAQWPKDERARWLVAGNLFGWHLMQETAGKDPIYAILAMLDGIPRFEVGTKHVVTYRLVADIEEVETGEVVESIELAPDGDGLGMGHAGWEKGNFGKALTDE